MSFRKDTMEIYMTGQLKRRLFWLLQVEKNKRGGNDHGLVTIDEIVGRLLNEKIEADYPDLKNMEKRMNALESQMLVELEKQKNERNIQT
jgi:hypothetical protein